MKSILITGSNGFIAKQLIRKLQTEDYEIIGISTRTSEVEKTENYKHFNIDITDTLALEKLFESHEISHVIHLAAIAHLKGRNNLDWNEFYRVNTLASKSIFKLAVKHGSKIFFSSTVDIYGNNDDELITEKSIPQPLSDYAKSKYLAEQILINEVEESTSYVIARFAPVYSPKYMKDVFKRVYIKHPLMSYKIGRGLDYHFVSINNVVEFINSWIEVKSQLNDIYNVCDLSTVNTKEIIECEKKRNRMVTIRIPHMLMPVIGQGIKLVNRVIKNSMLKKIELNLHKLTNPPRYSNDKMKSIYKPIWGLKDTVYQDDRKHF